MAPAALKVQSEPLDCQASLSKRLLTGDVSLGHRAEAVFSRILHSTVTSHPCALECPLPSLEGSHQAQPILEEE